MIVSRDNEKKGTDNQFCLRTTINSLEKKVYRTTIIEEQMKGLDAAGFNRME